MNPTLYTKLSPLGFAEWLEKNFQWLIEIKLWIEDHDKEPIGSVERTQLNALAFRWLREEKNLDITVKAVYPFDYKDDYPKKVYVAFINTNNGCIYIDADNGLAINHFPTHSLAEHEALNKALEILSKGGENG